MQGILRIITAQVETKKQRKIMNKSGIITTHGLTLNLLTSFFMILICVNKKGWKRKSKKERSFTLVKYEIRFSITRLLHQVRAKDL